MNPSVGTSEEQGEPSWGTGNWDQSGSVLESDRAYAGSRLDWDWDAPMILAQHPDGESDDRNTTRRILTEGPMASSLRAYTGILSPGFPSNFSQNPMGALNSSGIRSFVGVDPNSIGVMGSSSVTGIPGLAPTGGGHGDIPGPFEQRRRQYFGMMDSDLKNRPSDFHVKREDELCSGDGHGARIGLNLGVRTYFSTEDTAAGRLGKRHRGISPSSQVPVCQAEGCKADLSTAKHYHRRHKVCELHSKAANVMAAGHTQRFCQQCSRFHLLCEFDEGKRSCRKRLADHNRRRRKPQPSSSTIGGASAEPTSFKACADSNAMMIHLKKSASASSASMDDSDDKTASAGNSLQLRPSSGLELTSQGVVFNSENSSMSGQDAQALLSTVSIAPSVPLMIENGKRQPSILPGNLQDGSVYQHFLHGVGGHTGPNLSLTCLEGGLGVGNCAQSYNGMVSPVPWLRAAGSSSGVIQSSRRSTVNLQLLDVEKSVPRSHEQLTCPCPATTSAGPVYSSSVQNLLPKRPSRAIGGADWIVEKRDNVAQFSACLSNFSGGQLDEHQFALLENSAHVRDGFSGGDQQGQVVEFLQQHGGDVSCTGGIDMKFPELQSLRPGNFGSSVYESQSSIL